MTYNPRSPLDRALAQIRESTDMTDREWAELVRIVRRRANGPVVGTTLPVCGAPERSEPVPLRFQGFWLGQAALARAIGAEPGTVRVWYSRNKLPQPDDYVDSRPVWSRPTVEAFGEGLRELQLGNRAGATHQAAQGT
jgi:hypothetical protein